ncbi:MULTISPECIES: GntR family transcriptional regulator [Aneurinibacillus]|jgi:DNA-binding GntR family transcriptional regulator|uniref:GntR family transcriptional regulator n=1 Tax=Aneurinibacillus danicus TaxID=267746 RepID=A0A511VE55_9BACL|nr:MULTISPECIES: GntR family transcriptional regulator [Aneurinibacillus]GEN35552.1 GntR family transcriptional regulator [Aneurinibacillus danicus]
MEQIVMQPAREKVAAILRKAIFKGELQPGEVLSQEEIAKKLGISRMPVREAFQMLERDGLLILQNRRGAVVRELTLEDIQEHYELRALLEGEAAARAASKAGKDNKELAAIIAAQEEAEQAAQAGNVEAYISANEAFHRAIWEAGKGQRLNSMLHQTWNGLPTRLPELLSEQIQRSLSEHRHITRAISEQKPDEARAKMSHHIMRSFQDFVASRERTQQEQKNQEVEVE